MRLLSGNPGMYQHSIQQNTEGESTQQEPEHGEDTIARVKGTRHTLNHRQQGRAHQTHLIQESPVLLPFLLVPGPARSVAHEGRHTVPLRC